MRFGTKGGWLLRRLPFSSFPQKAGCFCQPRRRPQGFHAENCVCLMLRCCAFIAHRAPSQKGIARTRGRKSWQLTVAYNGFPALEPLRLPAAWQGINSCFFRHARCRRNIRYQPDCFCFWQTSCGFSLSFFKRAFCSSDCCSRFFMHSSSISYTALPSMISLVDMFFPFIDYTALAL